MAKRIYGDMMSQRPTFWTSRISACFNADCRSRFYAESRWRDFVMDNNATLKREIKQMMVENLMLQVTASEIGEEQTLFGAGSLGLDSVDALQLVVALDKKYGLKIPDPEVRSRSPPQRKHDGRSRGQTLCLGHRGAPVPSR